MTADAILPLARPPSLSPAIGVAETPALHRDLRVTFVLAVPRRMR